MDFMYEQSCPDMYVRRKAGQTICPQCGTIFNNAAVPQRCNKCEFKLDGKFKKAEKPLDAKLLTINLASVRTNSVGVNVRTFVEIGVNKKCYSTKCLDLWSNLSTDQRKTFYCQHLEEAMKACEIQDFAEENLIEIEKLEKVLTNKEDIAALQASAVNGKLTVYSLPGNNVAVPSFATVSHECPVGFIHIRNKKCTIRSCRARRSKQRTLTAKQQPICLHSLVNLAVINPETFPTSTKKTFVPKINRDLSINFIIENIQLTFPNLATLQSFEVLQTSRFFLESIIHSPSRNEVILQNTPLSCKFCKEGDLLDWPFKTRKSFLLSMGHISKIEIPLKVCCTCRRVFYPELYRYGIFPLHNSFLLTADFLMDFLNNFVSGTSVIGFIKNKLSLLGQCEGIAEELQKNLQNHSKRIEKACIALISLLISPQDRDRVICLHCGICPKLVNSDGNAKDTIKVYDNLIFDNNDTSEPPNLDDFKNELVSALLKSAFYQKEPPKEYNMLKLPLIIAPSLIRKQLNNDFKESLRSKLLASRKCSAWKDWTFILVASPSKKELSVWIKVGRLWMNWRLNL